MMMLALFAVIFISTGAYFVLSNMKGGGLLSTSSTTVESKEEPTGKITEEKMKSIKKKIHSLGKSAILLRQLKLAAAQMNKTPETAEYCANLDGCESGQVRKETEQFLSYIDDDDFFYISDSDISAKEADEVEVQMSYGNVETEKDTKYFGLANYGFYKRADLANALGVLGSDGIFAAYNVEIDPVDNLKTNHLTGLDGYLEKYLTVSDVDLRVTLRYPNDYNGHAFEDENLTALVEAIWETGKWDFAQLKALKVPDRFLMVIVIPPESSENIPFVHKSSSSNNRLVATISNVFQQPNFSGIFYALRSSLVGETDFYESFPNAFMSPYNFRQFAQSLNMNLVRNDRFALPKFTVQVYFVSNSGAEEKTFRENGPEIVEAILENNSTKVNSFRLANTFLLILFEQLPLVYNDYQYKVETILDSKNKIQGLQPFKIPTVKPLQGSVIDLPVNAQLLGGDKLEINENNSTDFKYRAVLQVAENKKMNYYFVLREHSNQHNYLEWIATTPETKDLSRSEVKNIVEPKTSTLNYLKESQHVIHVVNRKGQHFDVYFRGKGFNTGLFYSYKDYAHKLVTIISEAEKPAEIYDEFVKYCHSGYTFDPFILDDVDVQILVVEK